jgi:signal transduction histidine kinase
MLGKAAGNLDHKTWPKMQTLYFFIAACNLTATVCGLYLSHLVINVYNSSVAENTIFDRQMATSWVIADTAADAESEYIKVLDTKATDQAQSMFKTKAYEFRQAINRLRQEIPAHFDDGPTKRANYILRQMDLAMIDMERFSLTVSDNIQKGDLVNAHLAVSKMVDRYNALRFSTIDLIQLISRVKLKAAGDASAVAARLRSYEYYVGVLMALVIFGGAYYGHYMGRVLRNKFAELERTNEELADAHQQTLAFSKEIQTVNSDMGTLNRQLSDNLSKLHEAQDEALRKGKMAQLGNLTATVAHELRNPLSTVRTSTYLLARKIKDKGLGVEPQLQRINNGIIRCDNIITQLLDFSRSKAVKAEPTVLDVWLEKLIQAEAQRLPESISIECVFGLGEKLVELEPGRFERAMINLLSNASEALVGKGDDPKASFRENPTITITTRLTARGAEISVADNGPGIPPENLNKIREPLFTTKNFGTGLGIPAVEQILEQHSGGLEITSIEGQGATFTMWLPVHANQGEQAA